MVHRSSAGPTPRPFAYPFVELHITSLFPQFSPLRAKVDRGPPGVGLWLRDSQESQDVALAQSWGVIE